MDNPQAEQQIRALVQMGAKEFTGGDVTAFLRLAAGGAPDPHRAEAESLEKESALPDGPKPDATRIEAAAMAGGYLDNYLSLRAAGLRAEQAYFAAWYNAHPDARTPKTMLGVAKFLGRSRAVVYKWLTQEWFRQSGTGAWRDQLFRQHLATVDRMTIAEAETQTGAAGVAARKLFYEIGLPALGLAGPGGEDNPNTPQVSIYLPDNGR